ncbi:hypothetical protein ACTFIY_008086 [Dictyostelium cf. discoideum]
MTFTKNEATDKLLYSYIGIRLLSYSFFFILNLYQTIIEGKSLIGQKANKKTTRFYIFLSMASFCGVRIVSTALFYRKPEEWEVGSWAFFFFSIGTSIVFLTWVYILHFWLLIMYSFFVSEDVRLNRIKPIKWATNILVIAIVAYQAVICITSMLMDIKFGQAIGFLILLAIYCAMVIGFGMALLRSLQNHKKNTPFQHFQDMIFKTKVLLTTVSLVFICTVIEEGIYQFAFEEFTTSTSVQSNFITYLIDTTQMIVVMYILANGKFSNYILFRKVKTTSFNSNEKSSLDSQGSKINTKKSYPSNYDHSGKSNELSIDLDITYSKNSIESNSIPNSNIIIDNTGIELESQIVLNNDNNEINQNNV